jgi:hypothetical protein
MAILNVKFASKQKYLQEDHQRSIAITMTVYSIHHMAFGKTISATKNTIMGPCCHVEFQIGTKNIISL